MQPDSRPSRSPRTSLVAMFLAGSATTFLLAGIPFALAFAAGPGQRLTEPLQRLGALEEEVEAALPQAVGVEGATTPEVGVGDTPPTARRGAFLPGSSPDLVADVAERVLPSVVHVASTRAVDLPETAFSFPYSFPFPSPFSQGGGRRSPHGGGTGPVQQGLGSGVIVSADGLVLTSHHVVDGADSLEVTVSDGRTFQARVVGSDAHTDVAVLRLEGDDLSRLVPLPLGDSSSLRLGETVLAIGNPFGLDGSVSLGIVSAKGRSGMGITDYEDFIQTDAAINPGNSGGALVDLDGELVGIATAIVSRTGGYQGIGFAIPSDLAARVMDDLVKGGEVARGWLGVSIQDLDPDVARAMHAEGRHGALVASVEPGSPADDADLQAGDLVLSIDGRKVDGASDLRSAVALRSPGTRVELEVLREGEVRKVDVYLGRLASADRGEDRSQRVARGEDGGHGHGRWSYRVW